MTMGSDLSTLWEEAERVAKNVHLDKIGDGRYVAQLNRRMCICDLCSVECSGSTPIAAMRLAIETLNSRPLHIIEES